MCQYYFFGHTNCNASYYRHITTVIVTLNTPNNLEHVRIFIPRAPTLGIPETPEHHMLGTDLYVGDSSHQCANIGQGAQY